MLAGVNLLGRKKDNPPPDESDDVEAPADSESDAKASRNHRPEGQADPEAGFIATPRPHRTRPDDHRRGQAQAQGDCAGRSCPARNAVRRRPPRRAAMSERRERMMAGDDDYLLPRDKGPVRRFARDIVDSRRISVLGLFMPAALGLIFVMLARSPGAATSSRRRCWF